MAVVLQERDLPPGADVDTRQQVLEVVEPEGRHDHTVNSDVAHDWFVRVKAPEKHFVWFEHSAHEPESEEPGKFLLSLVRYARPIAVKVGDVAP